MSSKSFAQLSIKRLQITSDSPPTPFKRCTQIDKGTGKEGNLQIPTKEKLPSQSQSTESTAIAWKNFTGEKRKDYR